MRSRHPYNRFENRLDREERIRRDRAAERYREKFLAQERKAMPAIPNKEAQVEGIDYGFID